ELGPHQARRRLLTNPLDHLPLSRHIRDSTGGSSVTLQVNIAEAKAKLSSLLDRALAGEEGVDAPASKPLARLRSAHRRGKANSEKRELGEDGRRTFRPRSSSRRWIPRTSMPPRASIPMSSGLPRANREIVARYACAAVVALRRFAAFEACTEGHRRSGKPTH